MDKKAILELDQSLANACQGENLPLFVALITDKKEEIYVGEGRNRKFELEKTINKSSIFYLASMTKPITTAAALILSQKKKFNLDEPISKWIPSIEKINIFRPNSFNAAIFTQPNRLITARDLITHSSGFAHPTWNKIAADYEIQSGGINKSYANTNPNDLGPLIFSPGEGWEYSNTNIDLLANIIERIAGVDFREFVKDNILGPLDMHSTDWILNELMVSKKVNKFHRDNKGTLYIKQENSITDSSRIYGAGGLYGSAEDYAKFLRCIMNKGRFNNQQILSESSIDLMTKSQFKSKNIGMLKSNNQVIAKNIDLLINTKGEWSYGFLINKGILKTGRSPGSLTWFGSHNTYFWVDLELGISGIFLTQLTPCGDQIAMNAFREFETAYYSTISRARA